VLLTEEGGGAYDDDGDDKTLSGLDSGMVVPGYTIVDGEFCQNIHP